MNFPNLPVIDKQMIGFSLACIAAAALFFFFFQLPMVIPAYMIFDGAIALILPLGISVYMIHRRNKTVPIAGTVEKAVLENKNIIEIHDVGSGNTDWVVGDKKKPDDPIYETDLSGMQVDPTMTTQSAQPKRFPGGLDVYCYSYFNWVPQTPRNSNAFAAIVNYKKEKCREFDFLSDIEFIALISTPINHLEHDLNNYLAKYFTAEEFEVLEPKKDAAGNIIKDEDGCELVVPKVDANGNKIYRQGYIREFYDATGSRVRQEVTGTELILLLEKAKYEIWNTLAPSIGYTAGNEAFVYNAVAHMAQDLFEIVKLIESMVREEMRKQYDMLVLGIVVLMILVGGGLGAFIASMALKNLGGG